MKNKTEDMGFVGEVIDIPAGVQVFEDKRTQAKTLALPFTYPDGKNGVLMVSRLDKAPWRPNEHIISITIRYHNK